MGTESDKGRPQADRQEEREDEEARNAPEAEEAHRAAARRYARISARARSPGKR